jgi:hypothetical protein
MAFLEKALNDYPNVEAGKRGGNGVANQSSKATIL